MTSATVTPMSNRTALPGKVGANKLVREERKSSARNRAVPRYLLLLSLAPVAGADALPVRSLITDPASATGDIPPFFDRGVRATHVASDTQLLDPASSDRAGYERRIAQLRSFAEEDGIELSATSEGDFFDFACTEPRSPGQREPARRVAGGRAGSRRAVPWRWLGPVPHLSRRGRRQDHP